MKNKNTTSSVSDLPKNRNQYDDGNIPDVDLPGGEDAAMPVVEPLPESSRPRKDGPGGN